MFLYFISFPIRIVLHDFHLQARSQWNLLTEFSDHMTEEREIFQSVLNSSASRHLLDGTEMGIRVPGLLVRECSKEIHKVSHSSCFFSQPRLFFSQHSSRQFMIQVPDFRNVKLEGLEKYWPDGSSSNIVFVHGEQISVIIRKHNTFIFLTDKSQHGAF